MDSQERRVRQASKGNLEDQDPRVTLDTQEYLDFQVTPKFKKNSAMQQLKSNRELENAAEQAPLWRRLDKSEIT